MNQRFEVQLPTETSHIYLEPNMPEKDVKHALNNKFGNWVSTNYHNNKIYNMKKHGTGGLLDKTKSIFSKTSVLAKKGIKKATPFAIRAGLATANAGKKVWQGTKKAGKYAWDAGEELAPQAWEQAEKAGSKIVSGTSDFAREMTSYGLTKLEQYQKYRLLQTIQAKKEFNRIMRLFKAGVLKHKGKVVTQTKRAIQVAMERAMIIETQMERKLLKGAHGMEVPTERGAILFDKFDLPDTNWVNFASHVKENYPKVWNLGGNKLGNTSFENLKRAVNRKYWLDNEKWLYKKWKSYTKKHADDKKVANQIANLKWLAFADASDYEKKSAEISNLIQKYYPQKSLKTGGTVFPFMKKKEYKGGDTVAVRNGFGEYLLPAIVISEAKHSGNLVLYNVNTDDGVKLLLSADEMRPVKYEAGGGLYKDGGGITQHEARVSEDLSKFHIVEVWKNNWQQYSRHRFAKDAYEIKEMIEKGTPEYLIENKIEEQNKTGFSKKISPYWYKLEEGGTLYNEGGEIPKNSEGGYEYPEKYLSKAKKVDLITLPSDVKGTNCANCMYMFAQANAKSGFCAHPKILLPVTSRMCCALWDNADVNRAWQFKNGGVVLQESDKFITYKSGGYQEFYIIHNDTTIGYASIEINNHTAKISNIFIQDEFRGKGYGVSALRELAKYIHEKFPKVNTIEYFAVSEQSAKTAIKAFGKPEQVDTNIKEYESFEQALENFGLPKVASVVNDEIIAGEDSSIRLVFDMPKFEDGGLTGGGYEINNDKFEEAKPRPDGEQPVRSHPESVEGVGGKELPHYDFLLILEGADCTPDTEHDKFIDEAINGMENAEFELGGVIVEELSSNKPKHQKDYSMHVNYLGGDFYVFFKVLFEVLLETKDYRPFDAEITMITDREGNPQTNMPAEFTQEVEKAVEQFRLSEADASEWKEWGKSLGDGGETPATRYTFAERKQIGAEMLAQIGKQNLMFIGFHNPAVGEDAKGNPYLQFDASGVAHPNGIRITVTLKVVDDWYEVKAYLPKTFEPIKTYKAIYNDELANTVLDITEGENRNRMEHGGEIEVFLPDAGRYVYSHFSENDAPKFKKGEKVFTSYNGASLSGTIDTVRLADKDISKPPKETDWGYKWMYYLSDKDKSRKTDRDWFYEDELYTSMEQMRNNVRHYKTTIDDEEYGNGGELKGTWKYRVMWSFKNKEGVENIETESSDEAHAKFDEIKTLPDVELLMLDKNLFNKSGFVIDHRSLKVFPARFKEGGEISAEWAEKKESLKRQIKYAKEQIELATEAWVKKEYQTLISDYEKTIKQIEQHIEMLKEYKLANGGHVGGFTDKKVKRKNLRGGYNHYEVGTYSETYGYFLKGLNGATDTTATTRELKNDFEIEYATGGLTDRFFKITYQNQWKPEEKGYFHAQNHLEAIKQINPNVTRITNDRFREIEQTGEFYYVEEQGKGNKTFVFEVGNKLAVGGLTEGKSHAEGGIPMEVQSTGQMVELEGGEGVVNKKNMADDTKYVITEPLTPKEIVSCANELNGNGVNFRGDDSPCPINKAE